MMLYTGSMNGDWYLYMMITMHDDDDDDAIGDCARTEIVLRLQYTFVSLYRYIMTYIYIRKKRRWAQWRSSSRRRNGIENIHTHWRAFRSFPFHRRKLLRATPTHTDTHDSWSICVSTPISMLWRIAAAFARREERITARMYICTSHVYQSTYYIHMRAYEQAYISRTAAQGQI